MGSGDALGSATPVRRLRLPDDEDVRVLPGHEGTWVDGGEDEIAAILRTAEDLGSLSDELAANCESWLTRYHLSRERGNIVRPLALDGGSAVLEIGAGCGAVTRLLGEVAGTVDALEPTLSRARVARSRTRDLPSVEVFAGHLEALPRAPAYDAIVIIGVLEYVGGRDGDEQRIEMLREARARLKPGGSIACAIENRFGVQYLAGAPEEHLGTPFDGLEGYPHPGPARTHSRQELESLFRRAGLQPVVRQVFPDYKYARLLFGDSLLDSEARPLVWRVPEFPSAGSPHPRMRLASEELLWRGLVEAGLGGSFGNSFLVIAAADGASRLWPDGLHGVFYSTARRATMATETRVVGEPASPELVRRALAEGDDGHGTLTHRPGSSRWSSGTPLIELLAGAGADEFRSWLLRWIDHVVDAQPADEGRNVDLVPHNVLLADGRLTTVDEEYFDATYSAEDVIARGLLHTVMTLADLRVPEAWPAGCTTVRDVFGAVASEPGRDDLVGALPEVIRREAELLVHISGIDRDQPEWTRAVAGRVSDFEHALARPLSETALAPRAAIGRGVGAAREEELAKLHTLAAEQHHEIDRLHREVAVRDARIAALEAAPGDGGAAPGGGRWARVVRRRS